jgi:hypothetical protein
MKLFIITLGCALFTASVSLADDKVEAGPRKGHMLKFGASIAEFYVEKDRTISIAFYDALKKQQPAAAQLITATAEAPAGKKKLEFEKKGDLLVSKEPLPEGHGYNIVVHAKETANAKPQNFRIKLELQTCNECQSPEYACTCHE